MDAHLLAAGVDEHLLTPLELECESAAEHWLAHTPRNVGFSASSFARIERVLAEMSAAQQELAIEFRGARCALQQELVSDASLASCVRTCTVAAAQSSAKVCAKLRRAFVADLHLIVAEDGRQVAVRRLLRWVRDATSAANRRTEVLNLTVDAAARIRGTLNDAHMPALAAALREWSVSAAAATETVKAARGAEWSVDMESAIAVHTSGGGDGSEVLRHAFHRMLQVCGSCDVRALDPAASSLHALAETHRGAEAEAEAADGGGGVAAVAPLRTRTDGDGASKTAGSGVSDHAASSSAGSLIDIRFGHGKLGIAFTHTEADRAMVYAIDPSLDPAQQQWTLPVGSIVTKVHGVSVEDAGFRAVLRRIKEAERPVLVQFRTPKSVEAEHESSDGGAGGADASGEGDGERQRMRRSESQLDVERTQEEARRTTHEKAARDSETLRDLGVPESERIVTSYTCALYRNNFPNQGTLHLTHNYVAFEPSATLSFASESTVIHLARIVRVEQAFAAMVLPNAIQIETDDSALGGFFVFLSSAQRDRAYERLCLLRGVALKLVEAGLAEVPDDASPSPFVDVAASGAARGAASAATRRRDDSGAVPTPLALALARSILINPASGMALEVAPDGTVFGAPVRPGAPAQMWQVRALRAPPRAAPLGASSAATVATARRPSGLRRIELPADAGMGQFEVLLAVQLELSAEAVFEHIFKGGSIEQQLCDADRCSELELGEWTPVRGGAGDASDEAGDVKRLTRDVTFDKPVAGQTAHVRKVQTLSSACRGRRCVLVETVTASGPMFTDTFVVYQRTTASERDNGRCNVVRGYRIDFVKSTWMTPETLIKRTSRAETLQAVENWKTFAIAAAAQHYSPPQPLLPDEVAESVPAVCADATTDRAELLLVPSRSNGGGAVAKAARPGVTTHESSRSEASEAREAPRARCAWLNMLSVTLHIVCALLIVDLYRRSQRFDVQQ